jgi:hypothetical protein
MREKIAFFVLIAALASPAALAAPRQCLRDDANSQLRVTRNCNVKCIAVAAPNAPPKSYVLVDGMDKMPREITGRCEAEDGSPGVAGHGTICFPLSTIKFVTPCNVRKDLSGD